MADAGNAIAKRHDKISQQGTAEEVGLEGLLNLWRRLKSVCQQLWKLKWVPSCFLPTNISGFYCVMAYLSTSLFYLLYSTLIQMQVLSVENYIA